MIPDPQDTIDALEREVRDAHEALESLQQQLTKSNQTIAQLQRALWRVLDLPSEQLEEGPR